VWLFEFRDVARHAAVVKRSTLALGIEGDRFVMLKK
jgi:hypothetical protein